MPDVSIAISAKDSYSGVLLKLKNSMLATNKDAAGLEKQFGELTKELSGLQTELKAAERPLKNLQQEFKKTGDAATLDKMKEAQENYNNIKNNLDAVSKAAKQTQKDLDNLAKTDERKSNRAGGSSLASKIGQSGIISMIGNTAADAANTIVSSAFGSRTGEMFGSVLSGITSGAAMGTMLGGPVGTAVGAVVGGVTGVVQGAVNHFEKDDDEFKSVVESEFSRIDGIIKQSKESGSGIAAEREMTETSFRTLIGEEATNNLIPQLKTYADVTPFSYDTIMNSANQLLAFSVKPDKMMGLMKMFGDLSGGNADKLATIIRSYGKSFAAQRADSQDLGMMTEAGIPILSALAKIKKVSETKIRDVVSEGKVSAADVEKAIALLTTNGGMFEGMMEKMSQTYTGLLSTREGVEDDWDNAMGMGYNEERKKRTPGNYRLRK